MELFTEIDTQPWAVGTKLRLRKNVTQQMLEADGTAAFSRFRDHEAPFVVVSSSEYRWRDTEQVTVRCPAYDATAVYYIGKHLVEPA